MRQRIRLIQINVGMTLAAVASVSGGAADVDDARRLRELAEWYRAFAEVGHTDHRIDRLNFADYLDRLAEEMERRADGWSQGDVGY